VFGGICWLHCGRRSQSEIKIMRVARPVSGHLESISRGNPAHILASHSLLPKSHLIFYFLITHLL
jgi:hypothetical protein